MLNIIWLLMILVAVIVGGFSGRLPQMITGAFETAEVAVMKVALPLIGLWAIWLGVMRLAERAGLVSLLARALRPLMRRLFPDVPVDHPRSHHDHHQRDEHLLRRDAARAVLVVDRLEPRQPLIVKCSAVAHLRPFDNAPR